MEVLGDPDQGGRGVRSREAEETPEWFAVSGEAGRSWAGEEIAGLCAVPVERSGPGG